MAALPYMQLYVAEYLADTMHLTAEEHGAYLLLIFNYWQTGKPIPKNRLARIVRMTKRRWANVELSLSEFFTDDGECWTHDRVEDDLSAVKATQAQRTRAGQASAEARKREKNNALQQSANEKSTTVERPLQRTVNENATNIEEKRTEENRSKKTIGPSASDEPTRVDTAQGDEYPIKKPAQASPAEYPPEFELIWQRYPKRPGSNPKRKALQAWNARIKDGHDPAKILAGVIRYGNFCDQTSKTNTEYVMQAVRFLGASCEFDNPWTPPAKLSPDRNPRSRHSGFKDIDYSAGIKQEVPDGVPNF